MSTLRNTRRSQYPGGLLLCRRSTLAGFKGGLKGSPSKRRSGGESAENPACLSHTLVPGELLEEGVEVFQAGVFDDDFAAAVVVFDVNLEAEGALKPVLDFADVGVDGGL